MGKVAVVGGSGNVAREVIDAILQKRNHEVMVCSRKPEPPANLPPTVQWATVDYTNHSFLVSTFRGVDTILSFVVAADQDTSFQLEKQIIDAAIEAGVQRLAPSQWAARSKSGIAHYSFKDKVADYLAEVNSEKRVLQYTLFQPGFFTDYLAFPHRTSTHFHNMEMMFDFNKRRAVILSGYENQPITLTTVADTALVVAAALDYSEPWPEVGGICGTQTTPAQIIALGERLRGPFDVTCLDEGDVRDGRLETSWFPFVDHPSLPVEMREPASKMVLREYLLSTASGGWCVSDEWNKLLGIKLTSMDDFLTGVWSGKE